MGPPAPRGTRGRAGPPFLQSCLLRLWIHLIHLTASAPAAILPSPSLYNVTDQVNCMVLAPDGETIISGGEDKTLRLWRLSTGENFATVEKMHTEEIVAVAISPDQNHLATASLDKTIRTYRITSM